LSTRRAQICAVVALLLVGALYRLRCSQKWVYAGSDSYGYLRIAEEFRQRGRLALGPTEPLQWARAPLYPLLLAAVKGDTAPDWFYEGAHQAPWYRIKTAQIWIDVLVTGLLVYWLARRLGGHAVGVAALALAMLCPFTAFFSLAVLTETPAIALSTAAIAPLILGAARPRRWFPVAGALVGLATLLRPDGVLMAAAFVPALAPIKRWRERILVATLALAGFLVVFAPWPARNLARFGHAYPVGARIDRSSRPIENYEGYWAWIATWAKSFRPTTSPWTCFYDRNPACQPLVENLEGLGAFRNDPQEKKRVIELIGWRDQDGLTPRLDAAFSELAHARAQRRPLFVHLWLPWLRAWNMWVSGFTEIIGNPVWRPWPTVTNAIVPAFLPLSGVLFVAILLGGGLLLWLPQTRFAASVLMTAILFRTAALAYTCNCMPRYALEVMPLGFVVVAAAVGELVPIVRRYANRVSSPA
jgi:4-amino-4-deoxy-L-arabinose transferase-like glycosyltransferase